MYQAKFKLLYSMALAIAVAATACGPEDEFDAADFEADEAIDTTEAAITGPRRIDDNDTSPRWPTVVSMRSTTGGRCSGTVISPVHVLTAGHCLDGSWINLETPLTGSSAPLANRQYNVVATRTLNTRALSGQDLAVLLLDRPIPNTGGSGSPNYAVTPSLIRNSFRTTEFTWVVGYGRDCMGGGSGTRRGLSFAGGYRTYPGVAGVVTRVNGLCTDPGYNGPQRGDSGGPIFDASGRVVAVFSGWSCRNSAGVISAAGCTGTIEWTLLDQANWNWVNGTLTQDFDRDGIPDNQDPLPGINCNTGSNPACADILPDFDVTNIRTGGCTGSGGDPMVSVTVRNNGASPARAWVDVFVGLPRPPAIGTLSSIYRLTDLLAPGDTQTMAFAVEEPAGSRKWVDVLVDTTQYLVESNENNNHLDAFLTFPDCSFN